jgi:hypothetical protein
MTEVQAQTTTPPPADTVQPVAGAPMTAAVPPTAVNTTPNPNNNPAATLETQAGAGGGVDFEKMDANAYERYVESLPDDGAEVELQDSVPAATVVPAVSQPAEVKPGAVEEHEEGILAPGKLPTRLKVPTDDELSFHTARFYKESRQGGGKMTFGEAETLAKQMLGIVDADPAESGEFGGAAQPAVVEQPEATGRLADLTQQLEAATTAFEEAAEGFNAKDQAAALREINRLNREIAEAAGNAQREEAQAVTQQAAEQEAFLQQWQATEAQVHGMFAHVQAADPASPLHQRAAEIQASYRDSQDPAMQAIYNSPNSVLLYFTQAAAQLGVQPGVVPAAPTHPSSVKSTPPPVSRHVPVGAALLATQQGGSKPAAPGGFNLDAITNSHQLESLIERMVA